MLLEWAKEVRLITAAIKLMGSAITDSSGMPDESWGKFRADQEGP